MNILAYIIQKEFIQIIRNKAILPMMTVLPIVQLIVLSNAASNEVKNVNVVVVDMDQSESSRTLNHKIIANDRITLVATSFNTNEAYFYLQENTSDIVIEIPPNFENDYINGKQPKIQLLVNATNGQQAIVGSGYLKAIVASFNAKLIQKVIPDISISKQSNTTISSRYWYNPELKYTHFMAPGILAQLTALLTIILSAMNVVREREVGTIEQINVTPLKKWQFILGKLIPFLCIGLVLFTVGIIASKLIFNIPILGNLLLLFGYTTLNIIAVLGLGLLISNFADTQQQAIFIAFFFIIIFVLMSGLFTPIDSMPKWAQQLTIGNPLAHFISVSRKVLMKGSGFWNIRFEFLYTFILAFIFNGLAVWSYKKQV
ncbi:ABC transporter permease [Flavivirga jejuensis]|uniref:ABC transporter permease n=1 Tax=Flavivirga jejuensis TaxID=870487 RepID=A0ABT8WIL9_9FLAO|nr:ABC transporter permease [Flavivirga jejuensis]MDO5972970.1 ABC transporter permease [Flavivirga jejuensis]